MLERETRVLLEEVRSELKVVAEGHGSIVKRLDKVEEKLYEHDRRFDKIDYRFDKLDQRFDRFEKEFGSVLTDHEHRLKTVERKIL